MPGRPQPRPKELAVSLERILGAIRSEELIASPSTTLRLEGAIVALQLIKGSSPEEIVASLTEGTDGV